MPREEIAFDRRFLLLLTDTETRSPLFATVSTTRRPERCTAAEEDEAFGCGPAYI
jgi:hypothetical protein